MCTAIVSIDLSSSVPVLLVGVRDEFAARSWEAPGRHWPGRPGVLGGIDLRAGGTWLAVDPAGPRAATVLNARGPLVPEDVRLSRGELPLRAAEGLGPGGLDLPRFDPFLLVGADPGAVRLWHWDGTELTERELGPGLHLILNSGLEGEDRQVGAVEDLHMEARKAHFRPLFEAARRPEPRDDDAPAAQAWGEWLPLVAGGGLARTERASLLPLVKLDDGRVWGTTSVSLVALARDGVRYDFSALPESGDWTRVR